MYACPLAPGGELLVPYAQTLPDIVGLLTFGASIDYNGPETSILSHNLTSAQLDPSTIERELQRDPALGAVSLAANSPPGIFLAPGLVGS